ncbi:hypothetical protein B0H12DRAFT_1109107 [Mycena haematopus]|nr:hypothetical protein B0H12DRAFT_1109107 [Mycena haematopus]
MDPFASFDANPTLGAVQIGVLISYVLFGVATMQMYIYFGRFPDDPRGVKALTAFVWFCAVAYTLCFGHMLYTFTILDYAHPERLGGPPPKSFCAQTLFAALTAVCVQGLFAFRIYVFTKKLRIPCFLWAMTFFHLVGKVVLFATTLHTPSVEVYVKQWEWLVTTNWGLSAATDVAICIAMVNVLYHRRSSAHRKTAALVDKIILWTIETGMLTSVSNGLTLVCFVTMKQNYVWLTFYIIATGLFPISLLASLNSRAALREMDRVSLGLVSMAATASHGDGRQIQLPSSGDRVNIAKPDIISQHRYLGSSESLA